MVGPNFVKEWKSRHLSKTKLLIFIVSPYTLFCVFFDLNILVALCWMTIYWLKSVIDIRMGASDQKRISNVQMINCACSDRALSLKRTKTAWWRFALRRVLIRVKGRRRVFMIGKARQHVSMIDEMRRYVRRLLMMSEARRSVLMKGKAQFSRLLS